ncbi:hypothetical protein NYE39_09400 [Janibacter sp. FSL W8-0316]|uniref:hypothetical protein n=1 Tax=Janibacter sp. FSL W8-0316 TaxID=2975325 RepID=UPI0030F873E1
MSAAFQDTYPDDVAHCYGCGTQNPAGHQLKSHWDGEETVARFTPRPEHTAMPGYVYGGLIASLVDCHGTGSAAAAGHRAQGREMGTAPRGARWAPSPRCATSPPRCTSTTSRRRQWGSS